MRQEAQRTREKCKITRGAAECNCSFLGVIQTTQMHHITITIIQFSQYFKRRVRKMQIVIMNLR